MQELSQDPGVAISGQRQRLCMQLEASNLDRGLLFTLHRGRLAILQPGCDLDCNSTGTDASEAAVNAGGQAQCC